MARLGPAIPGSVATFMACSSDRSLRICSISTSLAYTSTLVRIPRDSSRGMRKRNPSRDSICISDIQVHFRGPEPAALLDFQLVIRHRLDPEMRAMSRRVARLAQADCVDGHVTERSHAEFAKCDSLAVKPVEHLA